MEESGGALRAISGVSGAPTSEPSIVPKTSAVAPAAIPSAAMR